MNSAICWQGVNKSAKTGKGLKALVLTMLFSIFGICNQAYADLKLDFTFQVLSGSDSIYVCNAGILSDTEGVLSSAGVGSRGELYFAYPSHDQITRAQCQARPQSCVTVNTRRERHRNSLSAKFVDWNDQGSQTESVKTVNSLEFPATADPRATLFGYNNFASWEHKVTSLSVNLGSALRSTQFFIDVCYRGPQGEAAENPDTGQPQVPFRLSASVIPRDLRRVGLESWVDQGAFARARMLCDLRGVGNNSEGPDRNGMFNTLVRDGDFVNTTARSGGDQYVTSPSFALSAGTRATLIGRQVLESGATDRIPRFCRVRYSFIEGFGAGKNSFLRSAEASGNEITISTEVERSN